MAHRNCVHFPPFSSDDPRVAEYRAQVAADAAARRAQKAVEAVVARARSADRAAEHAARPVRPHRNYIYGRREDF